MLKKISIDQIRQGMYVKEVCAPWLNHPFWRSSFLLKDAKDVRRLTEEKSIREVWIDTAKGLDVAREEVPDSVEAAVEQVRIETAVRSQPPPTVSFAEEVEQAAKTCAMATKAVKSMFEEVRMGNAVSAEAANELVEEISSSVYRNPGALISLARLKTADDYTYMHSVAVCALMISVARQLKLKEDEIRHAGLAGLLHDVGKAFMPMEILNKPGKLTDEEFAIVKGHPAEGHRVLVEGKAVGEIPLDVCRHHHEKIDGSGYPDRLKDAEITIFAKMGAVCDVYDAITSNRPYKQGWDPADSIQKMTDWSGHFDQKIFRTFVKCIGIYPTGSLVRLSSSRLGVVLEQSTKSLLSPHVKVFFSIKSRSHIQPSVIDLSNHKCEDRILSKEDPATWGIENLNEIWSGLLDFPQSLSPAPAP
ncbi:MAG: HD-GYP domain-containing protein [Betaproteobacteria bacterium]|nr:HD-GYP domain-containing protein [Betaproteobacteria bacterium]